MLTSIVIALAMFTAVSPAPENTFGRNPPQRLSKWYTKKACRVMRNTPADACPYTTAAAAMYESGFRTTAVGGRGELGMFQVMCAHWDKELKSIGFRNCATAMYSESRSPMAYAHILKYLQANYPKDCGGDKVFSCYNGGPRWSKNVRSCLRHAKTAKAIKKCRGPIHYQSGLAKHRSFLKRQPALAGCAAEWWTRTHDGRVAGL